MRFNLRNRSFVKEPDFHPRELRFLLRLSEAIKLAKYAGTEVPQLSGKELALIFEKTSTRTRSAFEVAARPTKARTSPTSTRRVRSSDTRNRSRTPPAFWAACTTLSSTAVPSPRDVEALAADVGVPVFNGLTDEWHPTQMLADFLTMHEACGKPYDEISFAFVGDCRFNMARSLLVTGGNPRV